MGSAISVPGKGRRTSSFDLNLVPFIDLLSSLIAFLLLTAVWVQAVGIPHDQDYRGFGDDPAVSLVTVHVRRDGVDVFRTREHVASVPVLSPGVYDWATIATRVRDEHAAHPGDTRAAVVTDDGVAYKQMIAALDVTRRLGLTDVVLGGGPAAVAASGPGAPR